MIAKTLTPFSGAKPFAIMKTPDLGRGFGGRRTMTVANWMAILG
jgi:hypothetical protein